MLEATLPAPDLSAILVTPDRFHRLRRTVRYLRAQTVRDRIELVLVVPSAEALADRDPGEFDGFHGVRVVTVGPITDMIRAEAPGIHAASAPVVALCEDHAYPQPDWAERILAAHRGPWALVGPAIVNANPNRALAWMNQLLSYGQTTAPARSGPREEMPTRNVSYKRDLLAAYGDRLGDRIARDGGLHDDLLAAGHRFYLEANARVSHVNETSWVGTISLRFHAGRLYGAERASRGQWTWIRRLAYVVGSPLIPLVRFRRLRRELFGEKQRPGLVPWLYPAFIFGLLLDAAGQAWGYTFGPGSSRAVLAVAEQDRYLTEPVGPVCTN